MAGKPEQPEHMLALRGPGPVPDSHTVRVECRGCGDVLPESDLSTSGHCSTCYYAGLIAVRLAGRDRKEGWQERAIDTYQGWEDYSWDYAARRDNATVKPRLPYDTAREPRRLQDMGLAPDAAQDRPLWQYDDMIHMRDESIVIEDGCCDYTDPPYTIVWRDEESA